MACFTMIIQLLIIVGRNRGDDADIDWWIRRDPRGYMDGMSLYSMLCPNHLSYQTRGG